MPRSRAAAAAAAIPVGTGGSSALAFQQLHKERSYIAKIRWGAVHLTTVFSIEFQQLSKSRKLWCR